MLASIHGRGRRLAPSALLCLATYLMGCEDRSTASLPVWTPNDHDNRASPGAGQTDTEAPRPEMPSLDQHGIDDVVLATWRQNCTTCHGLIGRGDGPQGAMFRPPDLTSPAFQARAIDSEILHTIEKGKGRMPGFGQLPKDTIAGLARLVRLLGAPPKPEASAAAVGSGAAPAASAPAATPSAPATTAPSPPKPHP